MAQGSGKVESGRPAYTGVGIVSPSRGRSRGSQVSSLVSEATLSGVRGSRTRWSAPIRYIVLSVPPPTDTISSPASSVR